jgi:hypothetical protein
MAVGVVVVVVDAGCALANVIACVLVSFIAFVAIRTQLRYYMTLTVGLLAMSMLVRALPSPEPLTSAYEALESQLVR